MKRRHAPLVLLALAACRPDRAGGGAPPATAEPVLVPSAAPREASAPASPFAVAIEDSMGLTLRRLGDGALMGVVGRGDDSYLVTLATDGAIEPLTPLVRAKTAGLLAHVAGTWPGELTVDYMFDGQWRTVGSQRFGWVVDASGARQTPKRLARFAVATWSDQRQIALTTGWWSALTIDLRTATFDVTVVRGPQGKLPPFPSKELNTTNPDEALVGYPSGRVFVTGWDGFTTRAPDPVPKGSPKVWVLEKSKWTVLEPPVKSDAPLTLVPGAEETQTLLAGDGADGTPYLARWTGTDFERVPGAPSFRDLAIGEDGSVWAIEQRGEPKHQVFSLRRASFPALKFEAVPLPRVPACEGGDAGITPIVPQQVVLRRENDVWVRVTCNAKEVLLHTETPRSPRTLPLLADLR